MKLSFAKVGKVIYPTILILSMLLLVQCTRNEKLEAVDSTDGDAEQEESDVSDGDADTDQETEPAAPLSLFKWHSIYRSKISIEDENRVWASSIAGLTVLDTAGTPDDTSDDKTLIHNEYSLEGWPTEEIVDVCLDASGLLWIATQSGLLALSVGDDVFDGEGDSLIALDAPETLDGSRQLHGLFCAPDTNGVIVSTSSGYFAIETGEAPEDSSTWIINDYKGSTSPLSSRSYASALDSAARLWVVTFVDEAFHLHAVEIASFGDSTDDKAHEIPIVIEEQSPTAIAADGQSGLWMINSYAAYHLSHEGSLDDAADDIWVKMPTSDSTQIRSVFSFGEGMAIAEDDNESDLHYLSTKGSPAPEDDLAILMPAIGISGDNRLIDILAAGSESLWYVGTADFGLLSWSGGLDSGQWSRTRFPAVGGVADNDMSGAAIWNDKVVLGGANGVAMVEYTAQSEPQDFEFSSVAIENPDEPTPFNIEVVKTVEDGLIVGGAYMAYLNDNLDVTVWNKQSTGKAPNHVITIEPGIEGLLWVSTLEQSIVPLVTAAVYNNKNTPENHKDDVWESLSNEYFGLLSLAAIDAIAFYDGCKGLIGNALGLHHYDCSGTPMDADDDVVVTGLMPGSNVLKNVRLEEGGGFWLMSTSGLAYLDIAGTPEPEDDTLVEYPSPNPSYSFDFDDEGRLIYFVDGGLLVHDTKGTPGDFSDDEAAFIETAESRRSELLYDGKGGIWFGHGDGSGVYYGRFGDLSFESYQELYAPESE